MLSLSFFSFFSLSFIIKTIKSNTHIITRWKEGEWVGEEERGLSPLASLLQWKERKKREKEKERRERERGMNGERTRWWSNQESHVWMGTLWLERKENVKKRVLHSQFSFFLSFSSSDRLDSFYHLSSFPLKHFTPSLSKFLSLYPMLIQLLRKIASFLSFQRKWKKEREREGGIKEIKKKRRKSVKLFHNGLSSKLFLHQILSLSSFLSLPLCFSLTQTLFILKDGFYGWKKDSRRMNAHLTPPLAFFSLSSRFFFPYLSPLASFLLWEKPVWELMERIWKIYIHKRTTGLELEF